MSHWRYLLLPPSSQKSVYCLFSEEAPSVVMLGNVMTFYFLFHLTVILLVYLIFNSSLPRCSVLVLIIEIRSLTKISCLSPVFTLLVEFESTQQQLSKSITAVWSHLVKIKNSTVPNPSLICWRFLTSLITMFCFFILSSHWVKRWEWTFNTQSLL